MYGWRTLICVAEYKGHEIHCKCPILQTCMLARPVLHHEVKLLSLQLSGGYSFDPYISIPSVQSCVREWPSLCTLCTITRTK